jgi:large subunit ribosomal protein L25
MSETTLTCKTGRPTGSPASRRLRAEGQIPGVIYGQGMSPVSIAVDRRELRLALSGAAGTNTLLSLMVDGSKYPAMIKEMQRHPIRRTVSHIDFLQVNLKEAITIAVPLRLEGEAKAVLSDGGLVDPAVDAIEVTCTPGNMPNEFVIDISDMQPGDIIRLSEVPMPAGVTANGDPEMAIVTALHGTTEADSVSEADTAAAEEAAAAGDAEAASE